MHLWQLVLCIQSDSFLLLNPVNCKGDEKHFQVSASTAVVGLQQLWLDSKGKYCCQDCTSEALTGGLVLQCSNKE